MRVRSYLRRLRVHAGLSVTDAAGMLGIAKGEISMYERGHALPRAEHVERMRQVYGPEHRWYPAGVLEAIADDIRRCPGCGEELDPDASKQRRWHEACK